MFTGLVESLGEVVSLKTSPSKKSSVLGIKVKNPKLLKGAKLGDSVAVNGCCLTITKIAKNQINFDVSSETLRVTNLGALKIKNLVNLEGALRLGDRLGGHMVSGHIDGLAKLKSLELNEDGSTLWIDLPNNLMKYVIPKGSVCLDGVSLTVNELKKQRMRITLVPTTMVKTTFSNLSSGWQFNLEVDMMGKYLERLVK